MHTRLTRKLILEHIFSTPIAEFLNQKLRRAKICRFEYYFPPFILGYSLISGIIILPVCSCHPCRLTRMARTVREEFPNITYKGSLTTHVFHPPSDTHIVRLRSLHQLTLAKNLENYYLSEKNEDHCNRCNRNGWF